MNTRLKAKLLASLIFALIPAQVCAQSLSKGIQYTGQSSVPCAAGTICGYANTSGYPLWYTGSLNLSLPAIGATTKGDLAVYSGSLWLRVGVGSDGQVLTADSTQSSGVKWSAASGGGIGGSITAGQVAFGAVTANTIAGSANFLWDGTNNVLTLSNPATNSLQGDGTNGLILGSSNAQDSAIYMLVGTSGMNLDSNGQIGLFAGTSLRLQDGGGATGTIFDTPSGGTGTRWHFQHAGTDVFNIDVSGMTQWASSSATCGASFGCVRYNGTNLQFAVNAGSWNNISSTTGTVTSIATSAPLSGGTITTTGTLSCPSCINGSPSATGDLLYSTSGGTGVTALADVAVNNVLLSGGVGAAPSYGKVSNSALSNSSITVTTASPLGGATTVSLGGSLALTCASCINGSPSAIGDLLYSTSGGAGVTALADVAVGSYLRSGGVATAPLWSTLTLPNTATTGDLLYASGSNTIGHLAVGTSSQVLLGGTTPTWGQVGVSQLSATGSPSSATFLRGDNTWAAAGGGSTGNWTFSGNNADLSGAAAMGIGGTTATSVVLGAAAIPTTVSGSLTVSPATNQIVLGTTRTLTLTSPEPATSSRTLTLPDPGGSDSVAYLALTQTLTSKTLTTPVIGTGLTATGAGTVDFSGATSAFKFPTGNVTLPVATGTMTGTYTIGGTPTYTLSAAAALGTTIQTTPSLSLGSTTVAANNAQQISQSIEQCGNGWKTASTASSETVCNGWYTLPVQGASAPTDSYIWYTNINAGTRTARLRLNYNGTSAGIFQGTTGTSGVVFASGELQLEDNSGNLLDFNTGTIMPDSSHGVGLGAAFHSFAGAVFAQALSTDNATKPTCAIGTGAGTGSSCTLTASSTDGAGQISVTTAGSPSTSATVVTVTFNQTYNQGNGEVAVCVISPTTAATAALSVATPYVSSFTGANFVLTSNAVALTTATTYVWNYICNGATNAY